MTPPVGTRFYWRLRACRGDSCSVWSRVHYLDVGRVEKDFNGDGFSEIIVDAKSKALFQSLDPLYVYSGSATGPASSPSVTLALTPNAWDLYSIATGDLNGDGFGDLVREEGLDGVRRAVVFFGGASSLASPSLVIPTKLVQYPGLAIDGDINADGYDDLVRTAAESDYANLEYYAGGPSGPTTTPILVGKSPAPLQEPQFIDTIGDVCQRAETSTATATPTWS